MTDARWSRIEEIVEEALKLAGEARAAYLREACAGDAELRAEVDSLLAREGEGGPDFLEPPGPAAGTPAAGAHTLGEFELLRELGRGGMGVVYLARQAALGREVAVKVLVAGLTTTEREIERFHREARATAKLRHPGIVQVISDGQVGDTHWFAMEYVPGHDLQRELQLQKARGMLTAGRPFLPSPGEPEHAARIARLCADVADALHCAHEHGLVHRDIKPQNLLLQEDGRVQVGDFGLVRDESLGSITRTGELAGTPHYMSPEQAHVTRASVDHRTDIYSLGVVLYELATHRRPYEGKSSADVLSKIRDTHPSALRSLNPHLPRDLETICLKAMSKDPRDRYATAAAFRADLRRFLAHEAIVAKPPTWLSHAGRWARRHRYKLGAAALLLLGITGGAFAMGRVAALEKRARLSISALDLDEQQLDGHAWLRPIDPVTGGIGALAELGDLPLRRAIVEPGYYRVLVQPKTGGLRVFARDLAPARETAIEARIGPEPATESMVWIPGGTLSVRDKRAPLLAVNHRDVPIAGYYLDRYEVTNAEYRVFLDSTGYPAPAHWNDVIEGQDDHLPVVQVGYLDAQAYAEWAGKRLPSFPEWLWAARGSENRLYPWPEPVLGEYRGNVQRPIDPEFSKGSDYYHQNAEPVESHPDACTASGLFNLLGNVREWTETFVAQPVEGHLEPRSGKRLIAGHDWHAAAKEHDLTTFAFSDIEREFAEYSLGFRCALSKEP